MSSLHNPQLELAYNFVQFTGRNIFLTGKAGTGKTTFLRHLRTMLPKRMIVVAPTGVAAMNAQGVTIHSFFQLPFGPILPGRLEEDPNRRVNREKIQIIKSLDLLVIDEISMVRADVLDGIDVVLRRYKNKHLPFGGVQLLMIGDMQQLAPVVKEEEEQLLRQHYSSFYFFGSSALQQTDYVSIELRHIYRQNDQHFIDILNKIRDNRIDQPTLQELNKRYVPGFEPAAEDGYIRLVTHNWQAQEINAAELQKLDTPLCHFTADISGDFPEYAYPTERELELRVGAQVMFVKNDPSPAKLYYNGKVGTIQDIEGDIIKVRCGGDYSDIPVVVDEWKNSKYTINEETKEITEEVVGRFTQFPLRLAWAITIHKSQGLTFERAIIDANAAFAHGQVYVALSRCKSLDGLVLSMPINQSSIICDSIITKFNNEIEQNQPTDSQLAAAKLEYQRSLLLDLFDMKLIQQRTYYSIKQVNDFQSVVFGTIGADLQAAKQAVDQQLADVAKKFEAQIHNLVLQHGSIEDNEALQERVRKAASYFYDKMSELVIEPLRKSSIETDNKAVRKAVTDQLDLLFEALSVKYFCMNDAKTGFTTKQYLAARAQAVFNKLSRQSHKASGKTISVGDVEVSGNSLMEMLQNWRKTLMDERGVPAYVIMPQKTIIELSEKRPLTAAQLKDIKGFGQQRIREFGADILSIVAAFCKSQNMPVAEQLSITDVQHELETVAQEKKPARSSSKDPKTPTHQISYDLFCDGKTIEQIADERGIAVTTVEGHLAHYVGTGDLPIEKLVEPQQVERIAAYFATAESNQLTPAKEALGDSVTYGQLRLVLKHLERK